MKSTWLKHTPPSLPNKSESTPPPPPLAAILLPVCHLPPQQNRWIWPTEMVFVFFSLIPPHEFEVRFLFTCSKLSLNHLQYSSIHFQHSWVPLFFETKPRNPFTTFLIHWFHSCLKRNPEKELFNFETEYPKIANIIPVSF